MALSWNEINERPVAFNKEWENFHENADAKLFLIDFFNVFRISPKNFIPLKKLRMVKNLAISINLGIKKLTAYAGIKLDEL